MGAERRCTEKPDPSALFAMAESLGVSSEEVLYIGDSEVDARDGKSQGYGYGSCRMGISITRRTGKRQMHTELWQRQMKFLTLSGKGEKKTDE